MSAKRFKVPYNYLPDQFRPDHPVIDEWKTLIASSEFTLGPWVEAFERKFGAFIDSPYVIGTNTGTDALILALRALGVGPGHEVITVAATFYATVGAIVAVGASPVFVDVDDRYQMDVDLIPAAITVRTKAVLPVVWAGASPDTRKIRALADQHQIFMVEDACMGPGGDVLGRHPGTRAHIGAFSMHPLKPLHVMGDGGMVCTENEALYQWMAKYRNHGMVDRDTIEFWGGNMRLQPLQAAVASHVLGTVPASVARRNELAARLDARLLPLHPRVRIPPRITGHRETFSLYMICAEDRDRLREHMLRAGVEVKIHYPTPLHLQPAARGLGYRPGSLPKTEWQAARLLTLPLHQFLSEEQVDCMVAEIRKFYGA